jgi:hypothetical protein
MRILEYHTFEREVNKADFDRARKHGDVMHWLDEQFRDDGMADSDINTESCELDAWELLKSPNAKADLPPTGARQPRSGPASGNGG